MTMLAAAAAAAGSRRDRETTLQRAFMYDLHYLQRNSRSISTLTAAISVVMLHG